MATEDLIAALQGTARVDFEGGFSFDREKAREKLRTYQVAEPQRYVLHLVALATLKGATKIAFECDSDDLICSFDGGQVTADDLDDLYNASFAAANSDAQRARQQLAIGLHAALAINPRHVKLASGTLTMLARHDQADVIAVAEAATEGTRIHVKQRFRPGLLVRFVKHLRGTLAEAAWLRERGRYAGLTITINGEQISGGLELADADHVQRGEVDGCRGVAGLLREGYATGVGGVIRLVRHGVWICDEWQAWLPEGLVAVVASDRLLTDLSGDKVVQDEAYARALALGFELAAHVVARAIGPGAEVDLEAGLRARLRPVWRDWKGALDPDRVVGEALGRVLMFTDLWGRRCTLARLRQEVARVGHLALARGEFAERLPVREALVLGRSDAFIDSLLAVAFGEQRRDVTEALEQDAQIEARRRRWRAQPSEARLNASTYVLVAPLVATVGQRRVVGEVGVRRAKASDCRLRVIVDGHVLTELEMPAPIVGVDAVVSGPLALLDDYSGVVRDELYAAVLVAWLGVGRGLAELALRRGAVQWGPGPELQALVYGLLRALRGEGLRASLQAGGFRGEALAASEAALRLALPLAPVQQDMPEQAWLQDTFGFATAGGLTLSVGALAAGLRQGLALAWVPESAEPHPGISAPVLRVGMRERDLLRWLFPAQVRPMDTSEYESLRRAAIHRARPAERFAVPTTHLDGVVCEVEGLRVALGFARELADWQAAMVRASCTIFRDGRSLARVGMWSPVLGVSFAIAGESLTVKPAWDGVVADDAYFVGLRRAVAAVPVLVREAIAVVGREGSDHPRESWRRGVLAALAASFPSVALRDAYARLGARHGVDAALGRYEGLVALASRVQPMHLERALERRRGEADGLDDMRELAAELSVPPPTEVEVAAVASVLRELRGLLGQTGGASGGETLMDAVLACAPEVGALQLFERVDGVRVSLAEATAQARAGKLQVLVSIDVREPNGYRRALRVDPVAYELLLRLYGPARVSTEAVVEPQLSAPLKLPPPPKLTLTVAPRAREEIPEDPAPTANELAELFATLELEARARAGAAPVVVDSAEFASGVGESEAEVASEAAPVVDVDVPAPRRPAPPNPGERLIAAVRAELEALRRGHEGLLTGFNLDHVRAVPGRGAMAVSVGGGGLQVHVGDPAVKRAIAEHAEDPVLVSFLVSRVYTALNVWREDITDADEWSFHARHLGWLIEGRAGTR